MKTKSGPLPQRRIMRKLTNRKGFTLLELLIAMAVILIMIISITPLILYSLKSIADSGVRSKAAIGSAGRVDEGIAMKGASIEAVIPVRFKTTSSAITIEGGVVTNGSISTFLADSPTVSITPFTANEGYVGEISVAVIGKRTRFRTGSTSLEVRDKNGSSVSYTNFTINSNTNASFRLPNNLRNSQSPISIKLTTLLSAQSSKNEIARASFIINMPPYVAVGQTGRIVVSDSITSWLIRDIGTSNSINNIIWGNDRYAAVGNGGMIYLLREGLNWSSISTGLADNLNDIMFTGNSFVIAGNNGRILSSQDGLSWTLHTNNNAANLNGAAKSSNLFAVAGNSGTILTSTDGQYWTNANSGTLNNLNDIIYDGARFVAVGNGGSNITSIDGVVWSTFSSGIPETVNLNGIAFNGGTYVAVGNGGSIYTRTIASAWTRIGNITNTIVFNDVIWKNERFLTVNSTENIFVLNSNGTVNSQSSTGVSNLFGVSGR